MQEVAEICYVKLNLVLIAIEARKYEGGNIWVNPRNKLITPNVIGLFLTTSSDAAKRAWFYCRVCHENIENVDDLKRCSCKKLAKARFEYFNKCFAFRFKFNSVYWFAWLFSTVTFSPECAIYTKARVKSQNRNSWPG